MPELDLTLAWNFATALLIGALVGIERERHKQRHEHPEIAGLRTFILVALFGALSGWVSLVLAIAVDPCGRPPRDHRGGAHRLRAAACD